MNMLFVYVGVCGFVCWCCSMVIVVFDSGIVIVFLVLVWLG